MKSARRIFRTGFACPYIANEIRPQVFRAGCTCPYSVRTPTLFVVKSDAFEGDFISSQQCSDLELNNFLLLPSHPLHGWLSSVPREPTTVRLMPLGAGVMLLQ